MNAPALIWMEKLPKASVQLAATLVLATLLGSNPPMTCPKVASVGVSSTIVIRVAFPKAVIELRPSKMGCEFVTRVVPSGAVPLLLLASS